MKTKGFSLVESLLSLTIFLIVVLSSFEFMGITRRVFFKLKEAEEIQAGAISALDKMKIDILEAGQGLFEPLSLGILNGIEADSDSLLLRSQKKRVSLLNDLPPGQTKIFLEEAADLNPGREICLFNRSRGEIRIINSVEKGSITLSSPLSFSYLKDESSLFLLEKISFFFDAGKNIIRRKTNTSSPQPLLEDVYSFDFGYEKTTNLVRLSFRLKNHKEKVYEMFLFPKNMALALPR